MADEDEIARKVVEQTKTERKDVGANPAAGPHAKRKLTDEEKTPGAGTLPDVDEDEVVPGSG